MKKLKYYTKLYFRFIAMALKTKLAYKVDSFIGILAFFATNAVNFAVLYLTINFRKHSILIWVMFDSKGYRSYFL